MTSSLSPPSSYITHSGKKRARLTTPADEPFYSKHGSDSEASTLSGLNFSSAPNATTSSSFRNVSACNRCRLRKNRCDQNLPACSPCERAGVKCVGFDPITKREIPRTYVYYLESRVAYLESILTKHRIEYAPSQEFDLGAKPLPEQSAGSSSVLDQTALSKQVSATQKKNPSAQCVDVSRNEQERKQEETDKLNSLVSNIGMVSVKGASDPRYLGSTSGISFARVVFAAVKGSVSNASTEKGAFKSDNSGSTGPTASNGTSMRDSFFGLHTRPTIKQAPFPDRELGLRLVELYFEHANPQIPILHRGDFMALFNRAYASKDGRRSPRELYMLNIVFAIGAGIILEESSVERSSEAVSASRSRHHATSSEVEKDGSNWQMQPEEYHSSAMVHLESCLGSGPSDDRPEGFGGGLEELQAVLLLAGFALLRPVAPGLWYITGVAVRLGVDLGLHYEDGISLEESGNIVGHTKAGDVADSARNSNYVTNGGHFTDEKEQGRREWVRDLRRRLWWCVYSFDRLVSTCVGRPFGISDSVITTEFPSVLDDSYITNAGFKMSTAEFNGPSYKRVAHHYFRLRLLQSEILQVLQYRQAQKVHASNRARSNLYMHKNLPSPFLQQFETFDSWRRDIDRRLWEWKESAPLQQDTAVKFPTQFLELNYWQTVIILYRQSLSVPPSLAGEISPSDDVTSPISLGLDYHQGEDEIFLKVAEAGQKVLKLYRQLHRVRLVNYTYLATMHLFMAGIAFLYAIWHSTAVRGRLTIDDVDFTVLSATSVLGDLIDKCPPAEACRDAFDRMSKATVKMCLSTTGFGSRTSTFDHSPQHQGQPGPTPQYDISNFSSKQYIGGTSRPPPEFDTNLRDLFPEQLGDRQSGSNLGCWEEPPSGSSLTASPLLSPNRDIINTSAQQRCSINAAKAGQVRPTSTAKSTTYDIYGFPDQHEFDFLTNYHENSRTFKGEPGLDLGIDEGHDWSDGMQVDLFDGFFFGNVGNSGL